MRTLFLVLGLCFLFACVNRNEKNIAQLNLPKVVPAQGNIVHKNSMAEPKVILVDEGKLKKVPVGKPKVVMGCRI